MGGPVPRPLADLLAPGAIMFVMISTGGINGPATDFDSAVGARPPTDPPRSAPEGVTGARV